MSLFNRRSRQSLGHPSQMGQVSALRLGKRMTLFMAALVGSLEAFSRSTFPQLAGGTEPDKSFAVFPTCRT
jgi:hypothetical protein